MISARSRYFLLMWLKNMLSRETFGAILSAFGTLWLLVEMSAFLFANTGLPDFLRSMWWCFGLTGLAIAIFLRRPRLSVSHKLNDRDIAIEIAIGDLFTFPGAYIIGTNNTFDTRISRDLISQASVQGVFTRRYYGDETQLDAELSSGLSGLRCEVLTGARKGKSNRYPIGTCVRLNPKECTGYFVAIAELNEHGTASSTFDGLKTALSDLWVFIGQRGLKESLVAPVLGTGFGRLTQTREDVIHAMVNSFIAACSEKTFADKLTIVITPNDISKNNISLDELDLFLRHECRYVSFSTNSQPAIGTPVDTGN